jgi:hypothetical protein
MFGIEKSNGPVFISWRQLVAVDCADGGTNQIPFQQEHDIVRSSDLEFLSNGNVRWRSINGRTGISGVLAPDDPRAIVAKSRFDGVTRHQAHTLWRTSPNAFDD